MNEKILVPLDGSKAGESALGSVEDMALKLSAAGGVEVVLLQVMSDMTFDFLTDEVAAQLPYNESDRQKIRSAFQAYLDKMAGRLRSKGIKVTTVISEGHAAEEIIKAAHETNATLIAMSTHGRSGLRRWALGSVTDKVLHDSPIPVLTVRAKA